MIAIVPVFVLLPLILIRYRRKNKKSTYRPNWEESLPLEITLWGVPILIVIVLSCALWQSTYKLDPDRKLPGDNQLNVQVIGLDWKWLFIYPDLGIATVGELAMPTNQPVSLSLTTDTVMQSFLISSLAGQIYAMPGMTTQLNLLASKPLIMEGENTQYNGEGFTEQKFKAIALSPLDFERWVTNVRKKSIRLDKQTYGVLARRATRTESFNTLGTSEMPDKVLYFTLTEPNLFHQVVHRYHSPGGVSRELQPGSSAYEALFEKGDVK